MQQPGHGVIRWVQHRRSEELSLRNQRPSVHVAVNGEVAVYQAAVAEAQDVTTREECRGPAVCVCAVAPMVEHVTADLWDIAWLLESICRGGGCCLLCLVLARL